MSNWKFYQKIRLVEGVAKEQIKRKISLFQLFSSNHVPVRKFSRNIPLQILYERVLMATFLKNLWNFFLRRTSNFTIPSSPPSKYNLINPFTCGNNSIFILRTSYVRYIFEKRSRYVINFNSGNIKIYSASVWHTYLYVYESNESTYNRIQDHTRWRWNVLVGTFCIV